MKMKVKLIKYSIFYVRVPDTCILKSQYTTLIDNKKCTNYFLNLTCT